MVQSAATTVTQYLADLPDDRREPITRAYRLVRKHLPKGYQEGMQYGMIGWFIPQERYPDTYNKQPLGYVALAAQKNYNTLYLMSAYARSSAERSLREGFKREGKKLDMGKCCVRFRTFDDLAIDAIGEAIAALSPQEFIEVYEASRKR
jgi:hypothetical protein